MLKDGYIASVSLDKQTADFLVHVAQKIHVGCTAVDRRVLNEEVPEQQIQLVPLPHHCKLSGVKREGILSVSRVIHIKPIG